MNELKEDATGKRNARVSNGKIRVLKLMNVNLETSKNQQPSARIYGQRKRTTGYVLLSRAHEFISPERQIFCCSFL